jgi:hypothetical protein
VTDWPTPTRADHEAFCRREGWELAYEGRLQDPRALTYVGRSTYVLALPGTTPLHTRISRPADPTPYGPLLWAHILKDQLGVTQAAFWACVLEGVLPDRSARLRPEARLSDQLVHLLNATAGSADPALESAARRAAVAHLRQHWTADR